MPPARAAVAFSINREGANPLDSKESDCSVRCFEGDLPVTERSRAQARARSTLSQMRLFLFTALGVSLSGCPTGAGEQKGPPGRCTAFGEQCLFAPGKLGSCVQREGCSGGNCLVCQSQH